jgi:hypothetical protein
LQAGIDAGRHGWFRWAQGPVPEKKNPTQSICLYDLMLLSVKSSVGTPHYEWREPTPCSDKVTRVLAILMAEESEEIVTKLVLYLQKKQNNLLDGFTVIYNNEEYSFVPKFVDRSVKTIKTCLCRKSVKYVSISSRFGQFSGWLCWKIVKLSSFVPILGRICGCPDIHLA